MSRVSLTMIVKNEAANLEAAIRPVRDVVDEIVVVDTGSTDNTVAIAERLGARTFHFPWRDSFSAARNEAIEHATGDWVLILDADDRMRPIDVEKLRALFGRLGDENVGYVLSTASIAADGGIDAVFDQVRLFLRRPELRYRYRVHEQIIPAIEAHGGSLVTTGIQLFHVGYCSSELLDRKIARNLRLAELDCAENPAEPFPMLNRGVMLAELGRSAEAIVSLTMCAPMIGLRGMLGKSHALALARAYRAEKDPSRALETIRQARTVHPDDAHLASFEAELLIESGDLHAAAACLADLPLRRDLPTSDLRARALLGEIFVSMGLYAAAIEAARPLTRARPGFGRAWFVLVDALLGEGRIPEVVAIGEQLAAIPGAHRAASAVLALAASAPAVPALSCQGPPWISTPG